MTKKPDKHKPAACYAVIDVIRWLQALPPDTRVKQGFEDGVVPVLFNAGSQAECVEFSENDGTWCSP
jgi:hypothetical protein